MTTVVKIPKALPSNRKTHQFLETEVPKDDREEEKTFLEEESECHEGDSVVEEDAAAVTQDTVAIESKTVTFNQVHIQEHFVTLGDHPSTMRGPPLTLSWAPCETYAMHIDEFECVDSDGRVDRLRRSGPELRMPPDVRRGMLKYTHTSTEIRKVEVEARKVRSARSLSYALTEVEYTTVLVQSAARKLRRFRRKSSKDPPSPAEVWLLKDKEQRKASKGKPKSDPLLLGRRASSGTTKITQNHKKEINDTLRSEELDREGARRRLEELTIG
jgi:hypothetical protein